MVAALIHGQNILLTDFGLSLDFSDDSVSTTTGRPSAWTPRYAAPELLNHEPRNRATDIYSLGCIVVEIVSRLYKYTLSDVKKFWKTHGNGHTSFALNEEATALWHAALVSNAIHYQITDFYLLHLIEAMGRPNRETRPTAQQIVDKLSDWNIQYPHQPPFMHSCCKADRKLDSILAPHAWVAYLGAYLDAAFSPVAYSFILADLDLKIIAVKNTRSLLKADFLQTDTTNQLSHYFEDDAKVDEACRLLLKTASRNGSTKDFWLAHKGRNVRDYPGGCVSAVLSAQYASAKHVVFTRLETGVLSGLYRSARLVQVTLIPILMPKAESYGGFFFMLSFGPQSLFRELARIDEKAFNVVDLTVASE